MTDDSPRTQSLLERRMQVSVARTPWYILLYDLPCCRPPSPPAAVSFLPVVGGPCTPPPRPVEEQQQEFRQHLGMTVESGKNRAKPQPPSSANTHRGHACLWSGSNTRRGEVFRSAFEFLNMTYCSPDPPRRVLSFETKRDTSQLAVHLSNDNAMRRLLRDGVGINEIQKKYLSLCYVSTIPSRGAALPERTAVYMGVEPIKTCCKRRRRRNASALRSMSSASLHPLCGEGEWKSGRAKNTPCSAETASCFAQLCHQST